MTFTAEFLLQVMIALGAALGSYVAIKSDLATLHERATEALHSAKEAHKRIDNFHGLERRK